MSRSAPAGDRDRQAGPSANAPALHLPSLQRPNFIYFEEPYIHVGKAMRKVPKSDYEMTGEEL